MAVRASIPNGIDLSSYRPAPHPDGSYFLCLGRICHEKGFDRALRAARAAGVRLLLAGQTFDYVDHQRYFAEHIAPLLDGERRFIGDARGDAKRALIANARAVVVPSRVAETCSLVTLEALSCGTPVIVPGAGAPASLIEPGVTGWVADDDASFAQAMLRAGELSRAACRTRALRFAIARTTQRDLELYSELAPTTPAGRKTPAPSLRAPRDGVELVTELARLRALEPLLCDLFDRDPQATPFQSSDWLLPWVEQLGAPAALRWLLIFRGGRAVGSLPLMRTDDASGSVLRWVGSGITDRHDMLLDGAERGFALVRARRAVEELAREVDRVELDELPTPLLSTLFEGSQVEPGCVCPVLELGRSPAELEAMLPRWLARNIQQTERRLARLGRVDWRLASAGDQRELVDVFSSLHAARWQLRGLPGVLSDPAVLAFHRAAAPRLLARGHLELEVGFLDGRRWPRATCCAGATRTSICSASIRARPSSASAASRSGVRSGARRAQGSPATTFCAAASPTITPSARRTSRASAALPCGVSLSHVRSAASSARRIRHTPRAAPVGSCGEGGGPARRA